LSSSDLEPLVDLGFTALEAEIYSWLLDSAPATGYRIAQALRKPAPNIYKALESLESKGAVIVDEGERRVCRPLPPDEVLGQLERRFRDSKARAARALSGGNGRPHDDRVYRLRSAEAVFERARAMLARAESVVLVDAFPGPLETLTPEIRDTAARGVDTAVLAYAPAQIAGVRVVPAPRPRETLARWPGQWLCLVVDGSEHLISLLSPDGTAVRQAIWTGSLYLSWVYHSAHSAELILAAVMRAERESADPDAMRRALREFTPFRSLEARGYRDLHRRVVEPLPPGGDES
jgi:sugar-specific transcriptional regulator TrmB